MFVIGGLSGIFMASAPVDIHIHDTYFIVAHIHYVLFGGSLFGIFAGIYHWFPKMFGRQLNQRWGVIHFVMTILAFNGTFFLMHILGIGGHPRRYASIMEFPTLAHLQPMNVFMTICAMMMGMAQLPFFYNVFTSLPRQLGRAMAAFFLAMLGLPMVMGVSYWAASSGGESWLAQLVATQPEGGAWQYTAGAEWIGYLALSVALIGVFVLLMIQLPTGGRISTVCVMLPVMYYSMKAMGYGGALYSPDGALAEGYEWAKVWHDVAVASGHGMVFIGLIIAAVYAIWMIGGKIGMPTILSKLLYVIFLPAFLAPLVLKKDPYFWLGNVWPGMVKLYPETMGQVLVALAICAVPGLLFLLLWRPKDEFGYDPGVNPWESNSLEWATSSPPVFTNFEEIPTVYRGPYEYGSPVVQEDYLPQVLVLPAGVVEPSGH